MVKFNRTIINTHDRAEVVPDLVRDNLPLGASSSRHRGAGDDGWAGAGRRLLAERREPRNPDFRASRAAAHQVPEAGTIVALLPTPTRENGEPVVEGDGRRASDVPRCIRSCG